MQDPNYHQEIHQRLEVIIDNCQKTDV